MPKTKPTKVYLRKGAGVVRLQRVAVDLAAIRAKMAACRGAS